MSATVLVPLSASNATFIFSAGECRFLISPIVNPLSGPVTKPQAGHLSNLSKFRGPL
jgi:hypothetical protein